MRPASGLSLGAPACRPETGSFLGMVIVLAFFAILGRVSFVSAGGVASWLDVASEIGIVALRVDLLMIAGELDVPIGSVTPAASMTVAIISGQLGLPPSLGVATALLLGQVVGALFAVTVFWWIAAIPFVGLLLHVSPIATGSLRCC